MRRLASEKGVKKVMFRDLTAERGRPIITDPLLNPKPYNTKWGNIYNPEFAKCREQTELFEPYVNKAIEAWNRRNGDEE